MNKEELYPYFKRSREFESPETKEKFQGVERVVVKGSVAYALQTGEKTSLFINYVV